MTDQLYREIPVPKDLNKIREVNDGVRWLRGVLPGTVTLNDGVLSFVVRWHAGKRRITLSTDIVAGYQCDE